MCAPTATKEMDSHDQSLHHPDTNKEEHVVLDDKDATVKSILKRGVNYGTLSLAVVVLANTVTMGHYQSRLSEMGCDSMCVGSMTSVRSMMALMGSTLIGMASDSMSPTWNTFGGARKACLLIGVIASAFSLALATYAPNLQTIWISMIPAALFQQNFNVLKALFGEYQPTSVTPTERASSVGLLGMAAGLAFMVGPLMGTVVLKTYMQASFFSFLCLLVAFCVIVFLVPTPISRQQDDTQKDVALPKTWTSRFMPNLVPAARTPPAIFLMTSRVCMGLAFHIFQTIWTVALKERFNFGPKDYGQYFAFIGLAFALSQGLVAGMLLKHFGTTPRNRTRLLLLCCVTLGGGRMLVYQASSLWVVYGLYGLIVMALGVVNTIFTADTSKIANPSELGGLFGVIASVESLAGIVGPILGGLLAKIDPEQAPLTAVVGLYGIVFAMVYSGYERIVTNAAAPQQKKVV